MTYVTGNPGRLMDLQWFAEEPLEGPPAGPPAAPEPPAPAPAPGPAAPAAPAAPAPGPGKPTPAAVKAFYEHTTPDGRLHSFADKTALDEAMKSSFMSQQDYSKKTKALATQVGTLRAREAEVEKSAASNKEIGEKYSGFKKFYESKPDAYARLQQAVETPPSPDESFAQLTSMIEEKFKGFEEKLTPFNDYMAQQAFEKNQNSVFDTLGEEMPDMDRTEVEGLMTTLAGDEVGLARAMAQALQFRKGLPAGSPEEQRRIAELATKKKNGRMLTGGNPPPADVGYANIEEAKRAALANAKAAGQL